MENSFVYYLVFSEILLKSSPKTMNPWSENESGVPPAESSTKSFEDDFLTPDPCQNAPEKLPDSEEYLGKLGRLLTRLPMTNRLDI